MGAKRKKTWFNSTYESKKKKDTASIKGCECSEGGPSELCEMTSSRSPMCMFLPKLTLLDDGLGGCLTSPSEGCRELSTQAKHTLTAIRNQEKILRPGVRLPAGAVTPGGRRCSSWLSKASWLWIDLPNLNPNKHFGDAMNCYLYPCCSAEKILRGSELAEEFTEFQHCNLVSPLFSLGFWIQSGMG